MLMLILELSLCSGFKIEYHTVSSIKIHRGEILWADAQWVRGRVTVENSVHLFPMLSALLKGLIIG